jgi:hypothetical protein
MGITAKRLNGAGAQWRVNRGPVVYLYESYDKKKGKSSFFD